MLLEHGRGQKYGWDFTLLNLSMEDNLKRGVGRFSLKRSDPIKRY